MGWIGYVRCEKTRRDFVSRTFVLTSPVQYVLHQVSCSYEKIPNALNTVKQTETLVWGPTWLIGCVRCEKSGRDFVERTIALIAPVHPVLHRVSCSYKTIPNASKHYATHQNLSLRSNGAAWVRS